MGPLSGVKVVEMGVIVAGPATGGLLAEWGADVIKIEPPGGDPQRLIFNLFAGGSSAMSPPFDVDNRSKKSVILDLQKKESRSALDIILSKADVFVTNYRQSALEKIGFSCEQIFERHPHLVVCAITGFGRHGPDAARAGYDVAAFWSRSGLARSCTPTGQIPAALSPGAGDHMTALAAAGGICAALIQKGKTGKGQIIDTSLLRVGIYANAWNTATYLRINKSPKQPPRTEVPNPMINSYISKDKKIFWLVGLESDRHWPTTAQAAGLEKLIDDPKFNNPAKRRQNAKELIAHLDSAFGQVSYDDLIKRFEELDVWYAPVQDVDQVAQDPQVIACGAIVDLPTVDGSSVKTVATPVNFNNSKILPRGPVPKPGEHTRQVLLEFGVDTLSAELLSKL